MSREVLETNGIMFEAIVSRRLLQEIPGIVLINNKIINTEKYKSGNTEIDIIAVHKKGVFVIECKGWNGSIEGKSHEYNWRGTAKSKKLMSVINPFHQNFNHIRLLRNAIRNQGVVPPMFYNLICLPDGTYIDTDCESVVPLSSMLRKIKSIIQSSTDDIDVMEMSKLIRKAE